MPIQLFVPKFRIEETLKQIQECLEKGWTGLGYKTLEIEEAWKNFTNLKNAHFLASNTVGLHLALEIFKREFGWAVDDEVISSPLTFVSTNHAILYAGLSPVFADVDESLCLNPESVLSAITPKTKAVMFVGIGGNSANYEKIVEICKTHNLKLILDAAHMAGTRIRGTHVGAEADAAVFSFQAVKNLPTADSGMICFREKKFDERARKLTWLGIDKDTFSRTQSKGDYKWLYEVEELGYKYHGNSIMAAMALVSLKYLDSDNEYRRKLAAWYTEALSTNPKVKIIEHNLPQDSSRHLFQIAVENRNDVMGKLNDAGIFPGVHYRDNSEYSLYHGVVGECPNARNLSSQIISLPMHLGVTHDDVKFIAQIIST